MSIYYQAAVAFISLAGMILAITRFVAGRFDRAYDTVKQDHKEAYEKLEGKIDAYAKESREAHGAIGQRIDGVQQEVAKLGASIGFLRGKTDYMPDAIQALSETYKSGHN